jgi:hypothetical protein
VSEFVYSLATSTAEGTALPTNPTNTLVHNLAHAAEAISHLIEFFRKGPRNQVVLQAIGAQIQELEDAFWDLLSAFDLASAVGVQLDTLGKILGERRGGRADEDYRAALRVRILVNSSDGKIEQLYTIILGMLPDAVASITEYQLPGLVVQVLADFSDVSVVTVAAMLRQAKAGGVRLDLVAVDSSHALIWGADTAYAADATHGWGSDTDSTLGGTWSQVA